MTELHESLEIDVAEAPKDQKVDGKVEEISTGTRAEMFNLEEGEQPKYGDREDQMVQIEAVVEQDGNEFRVFETYRKYEQVTTNSDLGKFLKKYGGLQVGTEVVIDYDGEGQGEIALE